MKDYYYKRFSNDLSVFMPDRNLPYFGHSWEYNCAGLDKIPKDSRAAFLICLYFTVLVDQSMNAHYRNFYQEFEQLTKYPKFCHGLGQFQKNPRAILSVPVDKGLVDLNDMRKLMPSGMILFVEEVQDFFTNHMKDIEAKDFFETLLYDGDVQIPLLVTMLNPELKDDIVVIAYEALTEAVKAKFENG